MTDRLDRVFYYRFLVIPNNVKSDTALINKWLSLRRKTGFDYIGYIKMGKKNTTLNALIVINQKLDYALVRKVFSKGFYVRITLLNNDMDRNRLLEFILNQKNVKFIKSQSFRIMRKG